MRSALPDLTEAMEFLSSDGWTVRITPCANRPATGTRARPVDAVCLFSGGLDSFIGAVDLLESGATVCLVSHYEAGLAPGRQRELTDRLRQQYGEARVLRRALFLRPAAPDPCQERPIPEDRENSMRARSLLFIAAGLAVASGYGVDVPLYVPENGLIGINVPLTRARAASFSTRTTHPHFLRRLGDAREHLGIPNPVVNPYRLATKGEMLRDSRNTALATGLAPRTLSCAHPEAGRLLGRLVGNCGYCFPCLIRRAALHHAGADTGTYAIDALSDTGLLDLNSGADLRALLLSLARPARPDDVLRNGPVPPQDVAAFAETHRRGRSELRAWLGGGHARIQRSLRDAP